MHLKIIFISIIIVCFIDTFTTAKPMIKQEFDLIATSSHHKLVKRVSNGYKDAFRSTGFAAIKPTVNNQRILTTKPLKMFVCFIPFFIFRFLVSFGNEVTNILRNLCLHFARQDGNLT